MPVVETCTVSRVDRYEHVVDLEATLAVDPGMPLVRLTIWHAAGGPIRWAIPLRALESGRYVTAKVDGWMVTPNAGPQGSMVAADAPGRDRSERLFIPKTAIDGLLSRLLDFELLALQAGDAA